MKLIGMFDSMFVRRVAISMQRLGMPYEHLDWSVGADLARIRSYSPLGRVPALVLDDGSVLIESAAILDYLDDLVGPARALIPSTGLARRCVLQIIAEAIGAAEKGREIIYDEIWRPQEKRYEPWVARCRSQMHGALGEVEKVAALRGPQRWLVGDQITQADISVACIVTFLEEAVGFGSDSAPHAGSAAYPALQNLVARCEALPEFVATRRPWHRPSA